MSGETTPAPLIESRIFIIRGHKVMLDTDPASLYEVETRPLNRAVRRNAERFPEDFMFQLTKEGREALRSQIVISTRGASVSVIYRMPSQSRALQCCLRFSPVSGRFIGSLVIGSGVEVQSQTLQRYQDHPALTNVQSPVR